MRKNYKIDFDTTDVEQLKQFFEKHKEYKTHEISAKYMVPTSTVRYWRRKCGCTKESKHKHKLLSMRKQRKVVEVEKVNDPEVWDNHDWFEEMYVNRKLGADLIARMIGKARKTVYNRLLRYGIETRSLKEALKSKNEYYSKEWLIDNYIKKNRRLIDCAKEAGVSPYTISNWLVSFGILPRDEALALAWKHKRNRGKRKDDSGRTGVQDTGGEAE